ncbi:MAG: RloB domain-containing protein, partial [Muribaculaceae bacterium]|nr:RloB domain-containing protein [Muribaculaceae bacterium]
HRPTTSVEKDSPLPGDVSATSQVIDGENGTPYSKAEGILHPEVFIVVFSNGTKREKDYFDGLRKNCPNLKLEFYANPISPEDLIVDVLDKKRAYENTGSKDRPDAFYTVTDVDHFYNDIIRSKTRYKKEDIRLIISNPCFEVWLYYSKRDDKFDGFEIPDDYLKISQEVKTFLPSKIPGGCNPKKAYLDLEQNIINAKKNYIEDKNEIPSLFATNMFLLAEDVLSYIKEDLSKAIEKQESIRNRFR